MYFVGLEVKCCGNGTWLSVTRGPTRVHKLELPREVTPESVIGYPRRRGAAGENEPQFLTSHTRLPLGPLVNSPRILSACTARRLPEQTLPCMAAVCRTRQGVSEYFIGCDARIRVIDGNPSSSQHRHQSLSPRGERQREPGGMRVSETVNTRQEGGAKLKEEPTTSSYLQLPQRQHKHG